MSPPPSANLSGLSPDKLNPRTKDQWTPPHAPSAAYSRRAQQIIETETGLSAPKLSMVPPEPDSPVDEYGADHMENQYGAGYRRARAGTLPSNLQQTAHRYGGAEDNTPTPPTSTLTTPTYVRTSALSPAGPLHRPVLRHSSSQNDSPVASSRLRSGSLTLPPPGIGNAFGASPFGNTWLATPGISTTPSRSPLRHPALSSQDDDLRNLTSPSNSAASLVTDDLNFSTLDYLGLADGSGAESHLPPASMSEVTSLARQAIENSGPASRLRASTVSNFARPARGYRPSVTAPMPYGNDPYDDRSDEEVLASAVDHLGMYDAGHYLSGSQLTNLYAPSNLLKESNRPRATTIGTLARNGSRNGYLAAIPQSPQQGYQNAPMMDGRYGYPPRSRSDRDLTRSRESSSSRGPRLSISSHTSRAATPDVDRTGQSTPQMPTRSLWIGNLDVTATSEALLHVFAPYGAIESLRMLPEKTCAFVNFLEKTDAIKARDDVLNRLGGQLPALSETAPVRIGFGKIDSAPNGMPTSTVAPTPPGLVFTSGTIGSVTVPPQNAILATPEQGGEQSSMPTRALWIGSIPPTTSSATLLQIFSPFGPVESARVLMHKSCGFVNFERLDSAISARSALNNRDILGSDIGAIRIGYARVPNKSPTIGGPENDFDSPDSLSGLSTVKGATGVSTETQLSAEGGGVENYRSQLVLDLVKAGVHEQVLEKGFGSGGAVSEQQMIMQVLSGGRSEEDPDVKAAAEMRPPITYYTSIPVITDRPATRKFDAARLRDLRKRLDTGACRREEIDEITKDTLEECAELASDYIGNTVVQKLFERTSPPLRLAMLERIAPHLAMIGIHKNGTWAAQKIIECSVTDEERALVTANLRAFCPPLMSDSLGNYVCAGTLRFGAPHNGYVFDAMIDRMWDIAQNRFGARCMRTCLESPHTSLYQKKRIATGIILNSIPLATNPNGALLLTWLVDNSNLSGRYGLLANRFAPHVAHLCTHKLASLTVLRIINQTTEPAASAALIQAIFVSPADQTLTEILGDASNGSQVIGKILATPTLDPAEKPSLIEAIRRVLPNIKASSTPPYRRLLEDVGLPVPTAHLSPGYGHPNQAARGWQQPSYGFNPYSQPMHGTNLSPLLIPQNMSMGQAMTSNSPRPEGSPRTPVPRQGGRLSPGSQMLSPASDPFNPFASPSIDVPYLNQYGGVRLSSLGHGPMSFSPQPNVGGLGIQPSNAQIYYPQNMGLYSQGF